MTYETSLYRYDDYMSGTTPCTCLQTRLSCLLTPYIFSLPLCTSPNTPIRWHRKRATTLIPIEFQARCFAIIPAGSKPMKCCTLNESARFSWIFLFLPMTTCCIRFLIPKWNKCQNIKFTGHGHLIDLNCSCSEHI